MNIKEIVESQNCEDNSVKLSVFLTADVLKEDMELLAIGRTLIYSEDFPLPYFKIITPEYTMRGALGTDRITIDFNSTDAEGCRKKILPLFE
ncbi:MAG: hypothetical protein LBO69_00265 [Ignavibacteria bacterium]|jgi:hypothetical protein|nr:hypothetical protein [Ignavibacteria bacterium]